MKAKAELGSIIDKIASPNSPVGMDAVYVHALILDKLSQIETRLVALEDALKHQPERDRHAQHLVADR